MIASEHSTDDARWEAMRRRDRDLDGAFFIAVRTTGVYCLASCAGRPLRQNVEFHDTQASARAAGFRPCLRCKPDQPRETLRYATVPTSLGLALVARSNAGLRLVTLGDDGTVRHLPLFPSRIDVESLPALAREIDRSP